jgi:hypothetical protein
VSPSSPHDEDIGYLRECGVVQGYPDGTYGPNVTVTREQMATYVARALAFGAAGGELLVDYDYFDGWYWGEHSYLSGWITYEEYQTFGLTYLWLVDMIWAHLEPMGYPNPTSTASAAGGPLTEDVVRKMLEVRERLDEQGVPPPNRGHSSPVAPTDGAGSQHSPHTPPVSWR